MADHRDGAGSLAADQIEMVARAIHAGYQRHQRADGAAPGTHPADVPWEQLSEEYRQSSRAQAVDVLRKLAVVGCVAVEAAPAASSAQAPEFAFSPSEVELLAEMEHKRWAEERLSRGWTLGPVRDDAAKHSPYLIPYADLPDAIKEYDRAPIREIPGLLASIGSRVVRT